MVNDGKVPAFRQAYIDEIIQIIKKKSPFGV